MKYIILTALLIASNVYGATLYVDKDNACPGAGTTGNPYCSIANAIAIVAPGDTIRIRDSATPYQETLTITTTGTAANPITVEPDVGNNPTLRNTGNGGGCASFYMLDTDYWTFQNLNFDATGVNSCVWGAFLFHASSRNTTGNKLLNNTFKGWGNSNNGTRGMAAVVISGGANQENVGFYPQNILVQGNTFDTNRMINLQVTHAKNITIKNNEFKNAKCSTDTDFAVNELGIKAIYYSTGLVIDGNTFHDFDAAASCSVSTTVSTMAAYWCDVGGHNATITRNLVYNLDQNGAVGDLNAFTSAFFVEAGCDSHTITNNVIYGIKSAGIYSSYHSLGGAANVYTNNTIYNVNGWGFFLKEGIITIKNNIVKNAGVASMCLGCGSGSPSLITLTEDYNLFDDGGAQTKIGQKNGTVYNLANWRTQCSCDTNSATGDPLFISTTGGSENLALRSSSPAINAGVNLGNPYNGSAPDIGAFETFTVISAEVGEVANNKVVINLGMNINQPVLVTNTTGWATTCGTISSIAITGSAQVTLTLSGNYGGGGNCAFTYTDTTGNATDSALIGNSLKQRLIAITSFTVVDNTGATPSGSVALTHWRAYTLQGATDTAWISLMNCAADFTNCIIAPGARIWVRYKLRNSSGANFAPFNLVTKWRENAGTYYFPSDSFLYGYTCSNDINPSCSPQLNYVRVLGTKATQLGTVISSGTTLTADQLTSDETTNVSCLANYAPTSIPALTLNNSTEAECATAIEVSSSTPVGTVLEMCPYQDGGTALTCATPIKLTVGSYKYVR